MANQRILFRLRSHDHRALDKAVSDIVQFFRSSIKAIVPLPRKQKKIVVNRSPHVHSDSREHYTLSVFRRLVEINLSQDQIMELMELSLPDGVDVLISVLRS